MLFHQVADENKIIILWWLTELNDILGTHWFSYTAEPRYRFCILVFVNYVFCLIHGYLSFGVTKIKEDNLSYNPKLNGPNIF